MKTFITNLALYSLIITAYSGNLALAADEESADLDDTLTGTFSLDEDFLNDLADLDSFDLETSSTTSTSTASNTANTDDNDASIAGFVDSTTKTTKSTQDEVTFYGLIQSAKKDSKTVTPNTQKTTQSNFRFSAPVVPEDKTEATKVLYRIPGAVEYKGSTMINFYSNKTKNKYVPCAVEDDQSTSQALYNLKLSQGAPKYCRESIEYNILPYRTFRRDF